MSTQLVNTLPFIWCKPKYSLFICYNHNFHQISIIHLNTNAPQILIIYLKTNAHDSKPKFLILSNTHTPRQTPIPFLFTTPILTLNRWLPISLHNALFEGSKLKTKHLYEDAKFEGWRSRGSKLSIHSSPFLWVLISPVLHHFSSNITSFSIIHNPRRSVSA